MADANANLRSMKTADVHHRAAFVNFLGECGLSEATLASTTGNHVTYACSACPRGVQNDFLAVRGIVSASDAEASTKPSFTSLAAGEDHVLLAVPIQVGQTFGPDAHMCLSAK